jgi:signal transduction histidine kinase/DNA-binding response OmpR family regulator
MLIFKSRLAEKGACVSTTEKLEKQIKELQTQLARQKRTCEVLKKRAVQAIVNGQKRLDAVVPTATPEDAPTLAEQASRVKSVFLENVSYEIRSSMNGIVGMTSLALETELNEEQRVYLEMVASSVNRLLLVVNEILDFSKIETGELEIRTEDFGLKECLDHDLYLLNLAAQQKGITLTCSIDSDVPALVHGDPLRLVQVVTNLVTNAIKYTRQGEVAVRIENAGYDHRNRLLLRFWVTDSGCGIAPDKLTQITTYFKQQVIPHTPQSLCIGTTGLGLTISAQLVKLMGGEITVSSGEAGSVFCFLLPFREAADISGYTGMADDRLDSLEGNLFFAFKGKKVLLAEDEFINRTLIETMLSNFGIEVTSVEDGQHAVAAACGGDYDLVLMDVQMPGMDGLEATRRIRSHERSDGTHQSIVALTALAMPGDREKCLQAGMDDYLAKPVEREELLDILTRFLTSRALVMDGDPVSQHLLVQTLIEEGWRVTIAETRRSVMYEASLSHFSLIILDLAPPRAEGLEAVRQIRELETYSGQRAVIVGLGGEAAPGELPGHLLDGQLTRPLDVGQLQNYCSLATA